MKYIKLLLALLLAGAALTGCTRTEKIKIATKPMTEQFILGEMILILLEANGMKADITQGIGGGTGNIQPALIKGEFDLYPEYTGTGWSYVLKKPGIPDDNTLYAELTRDYEIRFDLKWVGLYGFNNTYGLAVRKELADEYNLKTYSDLAKIAPDLIFGAEYDFYEREDGFDALTKTYGLKFRKNVDIDIGLKYPAINSGKIDVMNIFTTDGLISVSDITVLEDDKNFYQTYYCGTVVRIDALKKHPKLERTLMLMNNILNDEEMSRLNYEVEENKKNPKDVAREYLIAKGLIEK